jgi:hypothetical protein
VAVDGEAVGLPLADDFATQVLSGLLVVAMRTGEVELAAPVLKKTFPAVKNGAAGPSMRTSMRSPRD